MTNLKDRTEGDTQDETPSGVSSLLKDMILNIVDVVDSFAASGMLALPEVSSLLKVIQVIVDRFVLRSAILSKYSTLISN